MLYEVITPELLRCLTIFNMIELAALGLINVFWLISIHATGIMATLVITGMIFGWEAGMAFVLPFVIAVCAVRLGLSAATGSLLCYTNSARTASSMIFTEKSRRSRKSAISSRVSCIPSHRITSYNVCYTKLLRIFAFIR